MYLVLIIAIAWDLRLGEPPIAFHPVVWMGSLISACLRLAPKARQTATPSNNARTKPLAPEVRGTAHSSNNARTKPRALSEFFFGLAVALSLPCAVGLASAAALASLGDTPLLFTAVAAWLLTSSFSIRGLGAAGETMRQALHADDLPAARAALGHLCSRDASELSRAEVAGATIESIAENACDSFVAPLFFYALFGVPGAIAYRCINTLDSRLGYRGRYEYLGKASARIDDVANFIPARITALLFLVAGLALGANARRGLRIWWRDRRQTESPNAGQSMSMMAGLLGVCLEKRECYALGDATRPTDSVAIAQAWDIVFAALLLWALGVVGVLYLG